MNEVSVKVKLEVLGGNLEPASYPECLSERVAGAEWAWAGFVSSEWKRQKHIQRPETSADILSPEMDKKFRGFSRLQGQIGFSRLGGGPGRRHVRICVLERALCAHDEKGRGLGWKASLWSIWRMMVVPTQWLWRWRGEDDVNALTVLGCVTLRNQVRVSEAGVLDETWFIFWVEVASEKRQSLQTTKFCPRTKYGDLCTQ